MQVDICMANRGYLPLKATPDTLIGDNINNFDKVLKAYYTFTTKDLQDFDGVTAVIEADRDPTSSIFFYSNDTGNFIYQITTASPRIHLNKLLWDCGLLQLEKVDDINQIIATNLSYQINALKVVPNSSMSAKAPADIKSNFSRTLLNTFDLSLKPETISGSNRLSTFYCLKLKFLVNPFVESDNPWLSEVMPANSPDGGYVFYYPITLDTVGSLVTRLGFTKDAALHTINLAEVISKYSSNLKSIEVLPFIPNKLASGVSVWTLDSTNSGYLEVKENRENIASGTYMLFTECGIYPKYATIGIKQRAISRWLNGADRIDLLGRTVGQEVYGTHIFNRLLNKGGGARGFLRTPQANLILDFNEIDITEKLSYKDSNGNTHEILDEDRLYYTLNSEGFTISGAFKLVVPPHYINYYTDSSGNIFLQNATTNALAYRQLERDQELATSNAKRSIIDNALIGGAVGLASGNIINTAVGVLGGVASGLSGISRQQANYNAQKANLDDKIATDALVAKYTGKQVVGSSNIGDFISSVGGNFIELYIETNYRVTSKGSANTGDLEYYPIAGQPDYDYTTPNNRVIGNSGEGFYTDFGGLLNMAEEPQGQYGITFSLQNIGIRPSSYTGVEITNRLYLPTRFKQKNT